MATAVMPTNVHKMEFDVTTEEGPSCGVSFVRHRIDNQLVFAGAGASRPNFKIAPPKVPISREALI